MSHSWTYFLSMFQVHYCELMVSTLFHSLLIWRPRVNKLFLFMACRSAAQRKSNRDGWNTQWLLKLLMGCGTYPVFSHFFFGQNEKQQRPQRNTAPHMVTSRDMWYFLLHFLVINPATANMFFLANSPTNLKRRSKKRKCHFEGKKKKHLKLLCFPLLFISSHQCFDHWQNKYPIDLKTQE